MARKGKRGRRRMGATLRDMDLRSAEIATDAYCVYKYGGKTQKKKACVDGAKEGIHRVAVIHDDRGRRGL